MDSDQLLNNRKLGEELNQLSRLLFNSAANNWYSSILIEIIAGFLAVVLSFLYRSSDIALFSAGFVTLLLIVSYALRLRFDIQYDAAETMRRQSLLTEALGWSIGRVQMSEWRLQAGKQIRNQAKITPRDHDYYSSEKDLGPQRLAEMTIESAFYTRHLYSKLNHWIWICFISSLAMLAITIIVAMTKAIPDSADFLIAKIVFSIVPLILAIDLLGWGLRLVRLQSTIKNIEVGLERISGTDDLSTSEVLRLVSEYNCQVITGIPIHNWLFSLWCEEIRELWDQR